MSKQLRNYSQSNVIRDLENKGCKITIEHPIGKIHVAKCKNYSDFIVLKSMHPGAEIDTTEQNGSLSAKYMQITQPAYTVNIHDAVSKHTLGNKSLGKVDYMVQQGFQIMT